jgi:signal recognition particle subunit SEC65
MMNNKLSEKEVFKILKKFTLECVHGGDFDQGNTEEQTLSVLKDWWNKQKFVIDKINEIDKSDSEICDECGADIIEKYSGVKCSECDYFFCY